MSQFPRMADEPIVRVPGLGTVSAIFRIGQTLAARFPLRASDPLDMLRLLRREAAAMAEMSRVSPFPTPVHIAIGEPGHGYPLPWSLQTWLPGDTATPGGLADNQDFAQDLANLIEALRSADTQGRHFSGDGRGGDLPAHDAWMDHCFRMSETLVDVHPLQAMWHRLRTIPRTDIDVMSHGDLIPANLLVTDGRLAGVLDAGGLAAADPALDLVAAWHLLDHDRREFLRQELHCSVAQWRRGAAWALQQAMGLVWYYRTSSPQIAALGHSTLSRLLSDPEI